MFCYFSARMVKKRTLIFVITIWILTSLCSGQQEDDYVDPTDLINFDPVNVRMKTQKSDNTIINVLPIDIHDPSTQEEPSPTSVPIPMESDSSELGASKQNSNTANQECSNVKMSLESSISLFRQYVNRLVHILEPKVGKETQPIEINLRLRLSYQDISKLRSFGQGSSNEIHDVHETLVYMMQYASDILPPESNFYFLNKMGLSPEVLTQIGIIVLSILACLIILLKMTIKRTVSVLLFLAFVISVIFTWMEMYQKKVADQEKLFMTRNWSEDCRNMNDVPWYEKWSSYMLSIVTFKDDKCKEYFEAMMVNPLVKVSPLEAIAVAIVKAIVTPLGIIGIGIKEFLIGLLKDLPVQYQLLAIPVFLVIIILVLFLNSRYYLKIFGIMTLGPSEVHPTVQRASVIDQQVHPANTLRYVQEPQYHVQGPQYNVQALQFRLPEPQFHVLEPKSHVQEPQFLQQSTAHIQATVAENHARLIPVHSIEPCKRLSSTNVNDMPVAMGPLNDLSKTEQISIETVTNSAVKIDNSEQKDKIKHINTASSASLGEQYLKNIRQQEEDEHIKTDFDAEYLTNEMNDTIVTQNTPQEHDAEMHLTAKIERLNISSNLDRKDTNTKKEKTELLDKLD